ncbi:hypothetical protein CKJ67_16760 [Mycobacterium intracellulare]|nr:hypothetical protein AN480_17255 [Mycobacterium intracellulare subsp. chimaera]ASW96261.1 hypothetical protein CKJ67_16760 [Mycobacterium intracellulare]ELR82854.1 hypothetical protein W7U_17595 [Mycobacterium sp. H4Y]ARV83466.1 hypothetical protein BWK49_20775 [Mycobacterium intracellulare subsp. chimaera]ASQ87229.1 hypothetical protein CE197_17755 [Mycobacterium intracellulare subsp. chimaera]
MLQSINELQLVVLERSVISICAVCLHLRGVAVSDPPGLTLLSRLMQHSFADGLSYSGAVSAVMGHAVGLCPSCGADGWLTEPTS